MLFVIVLRQYNELRQHLGPRGSVVTIGVFDGIHRGHQALIDRACKSARAEGLKSIVLSFQQHPLSLLAPPYCPKRLIYSDRKRQLLETMGMDILLDLEFTREFSQLEPLQFINDVLVESCRAKVVVSGQDFSFGCAGAGTVELLQAEGNRVGFEAVILTSVREHDVLIKSTHIRDLLFNGYVEKACTLLTRPYELRGTVVPGHQRGRELGFPTANLAITEGHVIPARGVYLCGVCCPTFHEARPAMVNIGYNPTFGNETLSIEAHVLDFDGSLDSQELRLHFMTRLRDEQKFPDVASLVKQLHYDKASCLNLINQTDIAGLFQQLLQCASSGT